MSDYVVASEAAAQRSRLLVRDGRFRYLVGVAVLAGAYYGSAQIGYKLEFAGPVAAIVWPPVGVGISFLYFGGVRLWPGVLAGDLLANNYATLPLGAALGQTAGNVLENVVAALLIRRLVRRGSPLDSVGGVGFMIIAIGAGTALSATVGTLSSLVGEVISLHQVPEIWRTWWLGDACGALVVVPFALAWWRPLPRPLEGGRLMEAALVLGATAALAELAFRSHDPISYIVFPALVWAALRFKQRGATIAVMIAVGVAVWNTTHYAGPFAYDSLTRSVLSTQLFIGVAALSTLCLAAIVSERERFAVRLTASRARIVQAGDRERRRLEQNLHDGAQQRLVALEFRLRDIKAHVRKPAQAESLVVAAEGELELAIEDLRELAHGIHPASLSRFGLARAIEDIAARSTAPIEVTAIPSARLADATEATAYYVVAEAVTNAQRYARASTIRIRADVVGNDLCVEVLDDGVGGAVESGAGLQGLRDRVEAAGGTFRVASIQGWGTRIAAAIPIAGARD
jgi:signal transduction histidine kinase